MTLIEMSFPPLNESIANEVVSTSVSKAGNAALSVLFEAFGIDWNPQASGRHVRQSWKVLHRYGAVVFTLRTHPQFESVLLRSFTEREQDYIKGVLQNNPSQVKAAAKDLLLADLLTKNTGVAGARARP